MKHQQASIACGVFALLTIATASAQYALDTATQDAGGGTLTGATYALSGTVAQPDAGPTLEGATYAIRGGFWSATMTQPPANACAADFDNDGDVDLGDFGAFGGAFGSVLGDINYNPSADFDSDNDVDLGDFGTFGGEFGRSDCLGG